jgi:hypothetical protein
MNIDWSSKPICEDHPDREVVWIYDIGSPKRSGWHVHLEKSIALSSYAPSIVHGYPNDEIYLDLGSDTYSFWPIHGAASDDLWYTVYREPTSMSEKGLTALAGALELADCNEVAQLKAKVAKLEAALVKINNLSPESNDTKYISDYENQVMCIAYEAMEEAK